MTSQPRKVAFCRTCNARERAIVDGRCIVCGCDPKASSPVGLTPKAQPHDGQDPKARPQEDDER